VRHIQISRVGFFRAGEARGITIVIDVIRAFTVAAYAFAGGASRIWLVRTTDEAFALREREPDTLLAGEIGGRLIPGFDFNNSPARMAKALVAARLLIQHTGAGTQGAVNAAHSRYLLICSLVNAAATAHYASTLATETFIELKFMALASGQNCDGFSLYSTSITALLALMNGSSLSHSLYWKHCSSSDQSK